MNEYTPDRWVVLELSNDEINIKKVFAGWYGGYLGSDNWKLSSGIVEVKDTGEAYEFLNHSGSVYTCYKRSYGMTGLMSDIYSGILEHKEPFNVKVLEEYEPEKPNASN